MRGQVGCLPATPEIVEEAHALGPAHDCVGELRPPAWTVQAAPGLSVGLVAAPRLVRRSQKGTCRCPPTRRPDSRRQAGHEPVVSEQRQHQSPARGSAYAREAARQPHGAADVSAAKPIRQQQGGRAEQLISDLAVEHALGALADCHVEQRLPHEVARYGQRGTSSDPCTGAQPRAGFHRSRASA